MHQRDDSEALSGHSEVDAMAALQLQVANLRQELDQERNHHQRTLADFDNYRKRVHREQATAVLQVRKELLLEMIYFLDQLKQALGQIKDPATLAGLNIIVRQLSRILERNQVVTMECLGRPFDPQRQEGVGYCPTYEYPDGYVAEELSPGYLLGNELLKPAQVRVAKSVSTG